MDNINARKYMKMAIDVMKKSIQEPREDKVSPKVGAVLIKKDGTEETAFRGELRHGDHAEFTLLERKNRSVVLDDSILFATLEPCAPGARKHPKLGCAERIVNARIKKVWIGIEDPDPTVDRKGIQYLLDNGVEVEMFDSDLQNVIRDSNKQFIKEAEQRAKEVNKKKSIFLSEKENAEMKSCLDDLSKDNLQMFIDKAKLNVKIGTDKFNRIFEQLGFLVRSKNKYIPTGIGLLLFGERPQLTYPNALIRATDNTGEREDIVTIEGALINQADKIQDWYKERIDKGIDRSRVKRKVIHTYPLVVFREAIINALVHRDYDIQGAPIYFEINKDSIVIKSPGKPVSPLRIEQIQKFNAPSLSRNPKIMYAFDQLGLVEQRGLGFQTIKSLPSQFNLPLPIVSYEAPYMIFTFTKTEEAFREKNENREIDKLNPEELKGYQWIMIASEVSSKDYAEHFDYNYKKAQRHLKKMKDLGLITDNGNPSNSPNYKYVIK